MVQTLLKQRYTISIYVHSAIIDLSANLGDVLLSEGPGTQTLILLAEEFSTKSPTHVYK